MKAGRERKLWTNELILFLIILIKLVWLLKKLEFGDENFLFSFYVSYMIALVTTSTET